MSNSRQLGGQRAARKRREDLAQDEGSVRARFKSTLTNDPETREKYKQYLADDVVIRSTYGAGYRGLPKK